MNKTLKAAIVGFGFIGKQHYEAIRRLPNTEVVAIIDYKQERAQKNQEQYGIKNSYSSLEDCFKNEEIDVLHICTPNSLHYPMAKEAIIHGVHIFCEKPLSLTSTESFELVELAKKYNVKHGVNLNYRSNAMVREMRSRLINQEIGDLLMVQANYVQDWLMFDDDYDWHFEPEKVGPSRTIADIGSHVFDTVQFVTNQKIRRVYAKLIRVYETRKKRESFGETFAQTYGDKFEEVKIENEDGAMIMAQLDSGQYVNIHLSQVTGGYKNAFKVVVSGSKNSLTWDQERSDRLIIGKRNEGNEEIYADAKYLNEDVRGFISLPNGHAVGWADALKNSVHEFYKTLNETGSSDSIVDFNDGHYLMKIVEACLESDKTQLWVEIE